VSVTFATVENAQRNNVTTLQTVPFLLLLSRNTVDIALLDMALSFMQLCMGIFMFLHTISRNTRPTAARRHHNNSFLTTLPTILNVGVDAFVVSFTGSSRSVQRDYATGFSKHIWTIQNRSISRRTHAPNNDIYHPKRFYLSSYTSISSLLFSTPSNKKAEVDPGVVDGTDLRIVKYPHPALRAHNGEVTVEELKESREVADLARGMLRVMYAAEGVGLAAPQVGVNKRLMVYNPTGDSKKWLDETILVNPKIVEYSDAKDEEIEACLSFPGMSGEVVRSKWIKVEAMNLTGKKIKKKFTGWEARIFQHEYDHLDGTVYIDRLSEDTKAKVQPRLNELIEEFGDGGSI
jgi:peptide deformylase